MRPSRRHLFPAAVCSVNLAVLLAVVAVVAGGGSSSGPGVVGQAAGAVRAAGDDQIVAAGDPVAPPPTMAAAPVEPSPTPLAPPPSNLLPPGGQALFLARVQGEALRQVTAYGLPSFGVIGGGGFLRPGGVTPTTMAAAAPTAGGGVGGGPASAPAATTAAVTTGTNVQEAGVDEPDLAKTDGRLLVALQQQTLHILDVTASPRLLAALSLPTDAVPTSLLLIGTRVLVFASALGEGSTLPETDVAVVDLADPANPRIQRTHRLAGSLVSARLLNGTARVVLAHGPTIPWTLPTDGSSRSQSTALAANQRKIRSSTFEHWVAPGTGCQDAYTSPVESGLATVAVRTIDPAAASPGPGVCVTSQATTVYASTQSLYVGTVTSSVAEALAKGRSAGGEPRTSLHRFDITDPAQARYTGSGEVAGTLLNQFSLSEHRRDLRVATTRHGAATGSESQVAVLRPNGPSLEQVGLLGGLGRTEQIYAVRFVGDLGYVVTFSPMLCDPLFVVDLADPTRPRLRGSLEVQGFSSYLHPVGPGRVLSIGRDAPGSRAPGTFCPTTSTQLSLYDVARPDTPRRIQQLVLPSGRSEAEGDHHAFTWWAPARLLVIPFGEGAAGRPMGASTTRPVSPVSPPFSGALALRVDDGGITEAARITHPDAAGGGAPIRRSYVVGDRLLTVSGRGVASNDLASLATQGFVAF